jgi:hypothetical protein
MPRAEAIWRSGAVSCLRLELREVRLERIRLVEDGMKATGLVAMALTILVAGAAVADTALLHGSWKGPWYIGMTSGIVMMDIAEDGSGRITLTNLDEFGSKPVALAKQAFDGKLFSFSATGADGAVLNMSLRLGDDGKQLRGNGKRGGFGARMELQRSD